ncbi:D-alanyl-D-alanine carboxypeptidase/D-alanyl-D-alanine-endopeptidase [Thiothrix nivea]|uniref:D-alanyl-D-alaninecarboxypeptidase/D-alanyl-D-al anine-endopeptidase n=1 Tax=Thiothrix nivea (strain ATCC 35100 / DSM 5205 / JP2) TaxID=870187 RepID=A0A656HHB4_THINJ|nr:D-alanyl-D-alanine carboxypeptidase [Thiothrix nivea]EIJ35424.1 D-alanyl-D-alaninecarboxypeptidase/D-alanyl-D-al anine-endopeptidase [Thiothrix nivea DSM 5205]
MRILQIGSVLLLSYSIAACSQQNVQPGTAYASAGSTHPQTELFGDEKQQPAARPSSQASPSRQQPSWSNIPASHSGGQSSAQTQPTRLASAGGDKTYRGPGQLSRLPDAIAASLQLRGLPEQNLGAYVRPANGGQPLLAAYADTPRNPASTMKLVTTYSSLGVLGADYRWPTEIYTAGNVMGDTLQGDVIIKGYGNPNFSEGDFRQLLQALRARGIRNIAGNFVVDKTYFNVPYQPSIDGKDNAEYNAQPEALLYNERGSCYEIRNQAGQIQRICPIAPRNSNDLNANLFGGFWKLWVGEMGGRLGGGLQVRAAPQGAQLVHTHYSPPLRDVMVEINKESNNVKARQLLLSMGAKQFGAPGTTQKGAAAVGQFLESRGLRFSSLKIENGSGLSRVERISAREMGEMLVDAYNSPYRDDLMRSMAVLGQDGTVKGRLKNLAGRGKFKTGTLRNVRALAGYLTAANGQTYVVSLLHNDGNIRASAKEAHDDLVEWVYFGGRNGFSSLQ